jgi:hypothetical protein
MSRKEWVTFIFDPRHMQGRRFYTTISDQDSISYGDKEAICKIG